MHYIIKNGSYWVTKHKKALLIILSLLVTVGSGLLLWDRHECNTRILWTFNTKEVCFYSSNDERYQCSPEVNYTGIALKFFEFIAMVDSSSGWDQYRIIGSFRDSLGNTNYKVDDHSTKDITVIETPNGYLVVRVGAAGGFADIIYHISRKETSTWDGSIIDGEWDRLLKSEFGVGD